MTALSDNTKQTTATAKPVATLKLRPETLKVILAANRGLEPIATTGKPFNRVSSAVEQMGLIYFGAAPTSKKIAELKACLEIATLYVHKLKTAQRARIKLL